MRWPIVRLIWLREFRDQLRDRRTLFMVLVLPILLYPILGFVVFRLATGLSDKPSILGIVRAPGQLQDFPARSAALPGQDAAMHLAWLSATPASHVPGAAAFASGGHAVPAYPLLVQSGRFTPFEGRTHMERVSLLLSHTRLRILWLETVNREALLNRDVDLILSAPVDFYARLEAAENDRAIEPPAVEMLARPDDDRSRQARARLLPLLNHWKKELVKVRLLRNNLPGSFDDPYQVHEPSAGRIWTRAEAIVDLLVRIFPFLLVMWTLAGALYPAIDLCAGEKERGTMETLLISPAGREEIVLGKFFTIWIFSAVSALLNLLSMGLTTWLFGSQIMPGGLPSSALLWSAVLALPLAALFSAVCLAIGAYARSSKEGQYYLMPLFLVTMPLVFLTLAPGVELNPFYSLIPVTGVALLMQRLMAASSVTQVPWLYFIPVLAPIALYSWLALKWAIIQFHREEVLFREAERIDPRLWLKSLWREKEATPTTGQAFFCFGLILGLRWLAVGLGADVAQTTHTAVTMLAFVAAPALLMAVILNARPRASLLLYWPKSGDLGLAALLSLLLLPMLAAITTAAFRFFPHLTRLLEDGHPLIHELRLLHEGRDLEHNLLPYLFAFALLPALCEEFAFRGFILSGLRRRFRARSAIVLCSFLFALSHMNVFQFLPAFCLSIVVGLLTVRSKSLLPAILFHFLHNSVLLGSIHLVRAMENQLPSFMLALWPAVIGIGASIALGLLWSLYRKPYVDLERELALHEQRKS